MAFEYDVALSFAGEDREFVEECAEILRSLNVNVFYDNYEKETLLGKNLYSYLADVYQNRARFAVVFVLLLDIYFALVRCPIFSPTGITILVLNWVSLNSVSKSPPYFLTVS